MKKIFLILALGAFAACNSGTSTSDVTDSVANKIDSTADAKVDSLEERTDSLSNRIDSAADARIDTLQKKVD